MNLVIAEKTSVAISIAKVIGATSKKDGEITDIHEYDIVKVQSKEIKEKYTTPPKHFSEDTLSKELTETLKKNKTIDNIMEA